jgi:hypothetical protein
MIVADGYVAVQNSDQITDTSGGSLYPCAVLIMRNTSAHVPGGCAITSCFPAGGGNCTIYEEQTPSLDQAHYDQEQEGQYQGKFNHTLGFFTPLRLAIFEVIIS